MTTGTVSGKPRSSASASAAATHASSSASATSAPAGSATTPSMMIESAVTSRFSTTRQGAGVIYRPPFGPVYISARGLDNLRVYKYNSGLYGYLDRVILTPFWNHIVEYFPRWLAPNTITVLSLLCAIAGHLLVFAHAPTFAEPCPHYVYLICAWLVFAEQTLDGLDGKQARRIGASSPLGQLFDHGCDALCTVMLGLVLVGTVQLGGGSDVSEERERAFAILFYMIPMVLFFVSNWEESCTHFMRFGVIGVTESQYAIIAVLLVSGIVGPHVWLIPLSSVLPHSLLSMLSAVLYLPSLHTWQMRHALIAVVTLSSIGGCLSSVYEVVQYFARHAKEEEEEEEEEEAEGDKDAATQGQTRRRRRGQLALGRLLWAIAAKCWPLVHFLLFVTLSVLWYMAPATPVRTHMLAILHAMGLAFSYQASLLVLSIVSADAYPNVCAPVLPLPLVVAHAWLSSSSMSSSGLLHTLVHAVSPGTVVYLYLAYVALHYTHFVCVAIQQITSFLGIRCFHVGAQQ